MNFEKIFREWEEGSPKFNDKMVIKNSFFKKRGFWEQEPEIANAVCRVVLNSNFSSDNFEDLDYIP